MLQMNIILPSTACPLCAWMSAIYCIQMPPLVVRARSHGVRRCTTCAALAQSAGQLRSTPHSGYHYDGRRSRFFEGWYFKASNHPKD